MSDDSHRIVLDYSPALGEFTESYRGQVIERYKAVRLAWLRSGFASVTMTDSARAHVTAYAASEEATQ